MRPSLNKAVENVYEAFRDIPKPTSVDGCPCCIDDKEISVLLSKPLRELSPDDLTRYAASAFLTVGAVEDYLYFLPRILEILISERFWWPHPEVVMRAVETAGFLSWPEYRRQALKQYFDEVIDESINTENSGLELDSWICALGRLNLDLTPFLALIAAHRARLIEFYEVNSADLTTGYLANCFWGDAPEGQKQVVEWFRSTEIQKLVRKQNDVA